MAKQSGAIRFVGKFANAVGYKSSGAAKAGDVFMREHVAKISNPRSYAQAKQRAKLLPAALFYAAFANILDHAFIPDGKAQANRNRFMSGAMKLDFVPDVAKGEAKIPFAPYEISKGALGVSGLCVGSQAGNDGITFRLNGDFEDGAFTIAELSQDVLANNPGLKEGMEITFLGVFGSTEDLTQRITEHCSFVLDTNNTITTIADIRGTSPVMVLHQVGEGNDERITMGSMPNSGYQLLCGGVIISSKTTRSWMYTNSRMYLTAYAIDGFDWDDEYIVSTYMDGATDFNSDKILQQANNKVSGGVQVVSVANVDYTASPVIEGATYNSRTAAVATLSDGTKRVVVGTAGNLVSLGANGFVPVTRTKDEVTTNVLLTDTTWEGNNTIPASELSGFQVGA